MIDKELILSHSAKVVERLCACSADPRKKRGIRFPYQFIIHLIVLAHIFGCHHIDAIDDFIHSKNALFHIKKFYRRVRIPSIGCIRYMMMKLNGEEFARKIYEALKILENTLLLAKTSDEFNGCAIAIDGKVLRGAHKYGGIPPATLNVVWHDTGIVIAQTQMKVTKTNEIYPSEMKMQQGASERRVYKREAHTQATSNDAASSFPMGISLDINARGTIKFGDGLQTQVIFDTGTGFNSIPLNNESVYLPYSLVNCYLSPYNYVCINSTSPNPPISQTILMLNAQLMNTGSNPSKLFAFPLYDANAYYNAMPFETLINSVSYNVGSGIPGLNWPFFFGRTVYFAISGQVIPGLGTGPFIAF